LTTNAVEAISHEGEITVSVDTVRADDIRAGRFYPSDSVPEAKTYGCLSVRDTGSGMTPDFLDKIFDPFFFTRFVGRGLGLAVVVGIARKHKGMITVSSTPGRGRCSPSSFQW
jgi:signal transduction histidine kinase